MSNKFYRDGEFVVKYQDNPEVHRKVFDYLLKNFFIKHKVFDGETIVQSDVPQIEGPGVLAEIADFLFDVDYED